MVSDRRGASRCSAWMIILWDVVAGLGPVGNEIIDYDVADPVGRIECWKIGTILADFGL